MFATESNPKARRSDDLPRLTPKLKPYLRRHGARSIN
jgi:hypothetical protein